MELAAVQFNKIDALVQEVNTQLLRRPIAQGTVTGSLAWVRNGVKGGKAVFPVKFFSNKAKRRSPYEDIAFTPPELVNFAYSLSEWAPDGEMIPRGTQIADLYGLFESALPDIMVQGANEYEYHTAHMLGHGQSATVHLTSEGHEAGGATEYDGKPFFATDKLINPNRAAVGQFANFDGALNLDRAGLLKAFDHLDAVKGPDGRVMRMPGPIVVVVSNEDQYDRADVLLNGRLRGAAIGTAAASESNSESNGKSGGEGGGLMGRATVIKLPDLADYDSGKGWYAFKLASAEHRPLIVGIAEPPQVYIEGLSVNEHSRVTSNLIRYGWRGHWGHGYGWPQLAWKGIEK